LTAVPGAADADAAGAAEAAGSARLSPAKRALAERRLRGRATPPSQRLAVKRRTGEGLARLSLAQEQLWYFSRLVPNNPVYNESITIRKDGPFVHAAFVRAFNEIVRRHEAWRTTFVLVDREPMQRVGDPPIIDLPVHDLSGRPQSEALKEAAVLAVANAVAPYDLEAGPLIRPRLVKIADDDHRLYLGLHHLVFDGVSLYRIVLPELVTLYEAYAAGRASPLPEPSVSYGDYAEWERDWVAGPTAAARLLHWRHRLDGAPRLELPLDHARAMTQRFRGHLESFSVSADTVDGLRLLATSCRVTLFQVIAACYAVMLHRYSGQDDVVFGSSSDLRQRPELEGVVGMCLTPLVLRCNLAGDPSFADLVTQMSAEVIEAVSNIVPFGSVVRTVRPERDQRMNPLFQALLTLEPETISPDPSWSIHQMDSDVGTAKFDLTVELDERPGGHLDGRLILNADVFEAATGRRIVGHLLSLFDSVAEDPDQPVSRLRLLTADERHRQLVQWNATEVELPATTTVHELIGQQAQRSPHAVALEYEGLLIRYDDLEVATDAVAARLRAAGVVRGDVVALHCRRGLGPPIGMLGILKAGGAYLPLDPLLPLARLAFMVQDAGARVLLVEPDLVAAVAQWRLDEVTVVTLALSHEPAHVRAGVPGATGPARSAGPAHLRAGAGAGAAPSYTGDDLAYVLYTSGSTGVPKAVSVRHSAVLNVLSSLARAPGLTAGDTVLAVTSFGFDLAAVDVWLPLMVGARVVLAPDEAVADGARLASMIERSKVTFFQATPTTWQLLLGSGWGGKQDLVALSGGEPLNDALAEAILSRTSELWNGFGPTETTIHSILQRIESGDRVTIGRPIENTRAYVLDRSGQPVPVGVRGELFIGGAGVASGYLNRPDETAARFSEDPFSPGGCMYRTGDQVRQLADGRIEHLGRLDDQVKLRGHRIELGEIESSLRAHPAIAAAVVTLFDGSSPGGPRLAAHVVPRSSMPSPLELRRWLRSSLPDYMVPSIFIELDELPQTPNGKLDRSRLPATSLSILPRLDLADGPGASLTPLEDQLFAIWREFLGVESLGIDDDFFELGVHSLLAVRLVAAAETQLGIEIPVSFLYERGATVRGMAAMIESAERAGKDSSTAGPGTPGSGSPNLFFVVPSEPSLVALRHLQPRIGPEQAVVGLLCGRLGQPFDTSKTIEERAAPILESIVRMQDRGPYFLSGICFGGLIAYEIATQLSEDGQQVAWLGLVNTCAPAIGVERSRAPGKIIRALALGPRSAVAALRWKAQHLGAAGRQDRVDLEEDFDPSVTLRLGYAPRADGIALDLFVSDNDAILKGRTLGWSRSHAGLLRIHSIRANHSLLDERNVSRLVSAMRESIDRVR
jgi:amino acid adenylation domain-containing protein